MSTCHIQTYNYKSKHMKMKIDYWKTVNHTIRAKSRRSRKRMPTTSTGEPIQTAKKPAPRPASR